MQDGLVFYGNFCSVIFSYIYFNTLKPLMIWYNRNMKIARKGSGIASKVAIGIIVVAVLAVIGVVVATNLFENKFFAEKKFEELAKDYYENSLYESFIVEHDGEDLEKAFSVYKNGFTVRLRQLLNYEFLEHDSNYRSYFETNSFSCNTNTSVAIFKPRAPYGKKDYDLELNLKCSNL